MNTRYNYFKRLKTNCRGVTIQKMMNFIIFISMGVLMITELTGET